jgi:hypothetical protein
MRLCQQPGCFRTLKPEETVVIGARRICKPCAATATARRKRARDALQVRPTGPIADALDSVGVRGDGH